MRVQALDFSVDLLRNLLWQYNDATRLQRLLELKQAWYDENQTKFWTDWVHDVFDLATANDFGLSVWAIILNVPLVVTPPPNGNKPIWGFGTGNTRVNFNNGNFAATSSSFGLTTAQKRLVLRLRYFQLVTRGAAPEINAFMAYLFSDQGTVYVADTGGMKARYVFSFPPNSALELVLRSYDLLPRPAGVGADFVVIGESDGWGFGRYRTNFTNGNFHHGP
jgi:hypothetical protein